MALRQMHLYERVQLHTNLSLPVPVRFRSQVSALNFGSAEYTDVQQTNKRGTFWFSDFTVSVFWFCLRAEARVWEYHKKHLQTD